jgi:nucleoside-diphosphate-sugar epimerase
MKIAITGATGFIGRHVRNAFAETEHDVILVVRDAQRVGPKFAHEEIVLADLSQVENDWFALFGKPDALLHMAWGGLPNYMDNYHLDVELPMQTRFLTAIINSGLKRLVVTGTCYEYGLLSGALSESQETNPSTPYGVAKDNLRRELFNLQSIKNFDLTWARIFYPYGDGQSEKSLYTQLKDAILHNQDFLMGSGQQVLDFIQVEKVVKALLFFATTKNCSGIFNVGSGKPQSVSDFVKDQIRNFHSEIIPRLGSIPDRDFESVSFWSNNSQLDSIVNLTN